MSDQYDPSDHYWIISASGDVYHSARREIVDPEDASFAAWLAAGRIATRIATTGELADVLKRQAPQCGSFVLCAPTAADVKAEAYRRIVAIVPEWKQRNLLAQATLLDKQIADGTPLTTPQQAEWDAGEAIWDQIAAIRAASDVIEAMDPIPPDFQDDSYWP